MPLFRASALAAVGGYATRLEQSGAQGCEDWDLTLRVAEKYEVRVVPRYLVDYREVPSGMSFGGAGMAASFAWLQRGLQARNPGVPAHLHRWAGGFFHLYLARKCHHAGLTREALSYLRIGTLIDPAIAVTPLFYRVLAGCARRELLGKRRVAALQKRPFSARRAKSSTAPLWSIFAYIEGVRWARLAAEEEAG